LLANNAFFDELLRAKDEMDLSSSAQASLGVSSEVARQFLRNMEDVVRAYLKEYSPDDPARGAMQKMLTEDLLSGIQSAVLSQYSGYDRFSSDECVAFHGVCLHRGLMSHMGHQMAQIGPGLRDDQSSGLLGLVFAVDHARRAADRMRQIAAGVDR